MKTNKLFRRLTKTGVTSLFAFAFIWQVTFLSMPAAIADPIEPESNLAIEVIEQPSLAIPGSTEDKIDAIANLENKQSDAGPEVVENSVEEVIEAVEELLLEIVESAENQPSPIQEQTLKDLDSQPSGEISAVKSDVLPEPDMSKRLDEAVDPESGESKLADEIKQPTAEQPAPQVKKDTHQIIAETEAGDEETEVENVLLILDTPSDNTTNILPALGLSKPVEAESVEPVGNQTEQADETDIMPALDLNKPAEVESVEPAGNQTDKPVEIEIIEPVRDESELADEIKQPAVEQLAPQSEDNTLQVAAEDEVKGGVTILEQAPLFKEGDPDNLSISTELDSNGQVEVEIVDLVKDESELVDEIKQSTEERLASQVNAGNTETFDKIQAEDQEISSKVVRTSQDYVELFQAWLNRYFYRYF